MKKYSSEDFFKLIKRDDILSVAEFVTSLKISSPLIFVSNDSLRLRRAVSWLTNSITESEVVTYFSSDLGAKNSIAPIVQALKNASLFSKQQIIIIHNANKLKANILEEIVSASSGAQVFSLLIFFTEELSANLQKVGTVVEFEEFSKQKIARWIKKEFLDLGFSQIEPSALEFICNSFNGNLGDLSNDISRICLLAVENELIKLALVKAVVLTNAEASGFELFASISQGKVELAQEKLTLMFQQGMHPLQVNAFLSRCYRTLAANGAGSKELSNPWFSSKIKRYAKSYSSRYLAHSLNKLAELDFALKDSGLPHEEKMSNTVLRFSLRA